VKMDVFVAGAPAVLFGLMGVQIVQDNMQFAVRVLGDEGS
jgi:hypothetical protein